MSWMEEASQFFKEYKAEGGKLKWQPFLTRVGKYETQFPDRPQIPKKTYWTLLEVHELLVREARRIATKQALEWRLLEATSKKS